MRLIGGELDHAVAEPDALGALAGGAEEYFRRGRVRVFLEKVMLDFPRIVVAELVGQLDLRQRILQELVLALRSPRPRQLMLVENAEFHDYFLIDNLILRSGRRPRLEGWATRLALRDGRFAASSG